MGGLVEHGMSVTMGVVTHSALCLQRKVVTQWVAVILLHPSWCAAPSGAPLPLCCDKMGVVSRYIFRLASLGVT